MGIAVSPDGGTVYVANSGDSTISVIDNATRTVIDTVTVGSSPFDVAVSPDGAAVYVTNSGDHTVSVIETATHTVIATVPVGDTPVGVEVTTDGSAAYVLNQRDQTAMVIATASNSVIETLPDMRGILAFGRFIDPELTTLNGTVTGAGLNRVICRNLTTRQTVLIRDGAKVFDCKDAGLNINEGDRVDIIIKGTVN